MDPVDHPIPADVLRLIPGGRQRLEDEYVWALMTGDPNAELLGRRLQPSANDCLFIPSIVETRPSDGR